MNFLKNEKILSVRIASSAMRDIIFSVDKRIKKKEQTVIYTPNPQILLRAERFRTYQNILNSSTINLPDGIGVVLASKIRKGNIKKRVGGIDFAQAILSLAQKKRYKIFLLGAKPNTVFKAKRNLQKKHPSLLICGAHHGYFKKHGKENDALIKKISSASPDILFVCLGAPSQEIWIAKNKDRLPNVTLFIGLGGSLDVFAGNTKRAPKFMRAAGLEWLYRAIKEPKRAKIFLDIPIFLFKILKYKK